MTRRAARVAALAATAGVDLDEALVTLWDSGLDFVEDADTLIPSRHVAAARGALGIGIDRSQFEIEYWEHAAGLSRVDLAARMAEVGVSLSPTARKIPKGSLRRFELLFGTDARPEPDRAPAPTSKTRLPSPLPPLVWPTDSDGIELHHLTAEELIAIHEALTEDFASTDDPISPPGVRDEGLLRSAAERPKTSYGDARKYQTVELAAAALFHSVVQNHSFHNGNKRTGLVALLVFLDRHGFVLTCDEQALFKQTLLVAAHGVVTAKGVDQLADREVLEIAKWIKGNTRRLGHAEHPMNWRKLRQRLRGYGCECAPAGTVGNRLNIERSIRESPRLGLIPRKARRLRTQVAWSGDGTDADRDTIRKIRRDLELDDAHDVDSGTFYEGVKVDGFIIQYRRILGRLARL